MANIYFAGLPKPFYEYLACNVTIYNRSSQRLLNADVETNWGKYTTDPITNMTAGTSSSFVMKGRDSSPSGCEGSVEYDVGDLGLGSVKFFYNCPVDGDNQATPTSNSPVVILSVYSNTEEVWTWNLENESTWGKEGQVPNDGHPLNILFVVDDL